MAILLEGYSLVFQIEAVEQKYPGGTHGLVYDWNNGSWCSDGSIGRLSYYGKDDAFCCYVTLADRGLDIGTFFRNTSGAIGRWPITLPKTRPFWRGTLLPSSGRPALSRTATTGWTERSKARVFCLGTN